MNIAVSPTFYSHKKTTGFKGIPLGNAKNMYKGVETAIDFYLVEPKDFKFLKKLSNALDMKKLAPSKSGLRGFEKWKEMIDSAIEEAMGCKQTVLAVHDNRPCGICSFSFFPDNKLETDFFATWYTSVDKAVPLAGKSLMRQIYSVADKKGAGKISLMPLLTGHSDTLSFYKSLGFEQKNNHLYMSISKSQRNAKTEELDKILNYDEISTAESVNLSERLNLDYYGETNKSVWSKLVDMLKI